MIVTFISLLMLCLVVLKSPVIIAKLPIFPFNISQILFPIDCPTTLACHARHEVSVASTEDCYNRNHREKEK